MEISNAIIESVSIDDGDRGLLTAWLFCSDGRGTQGFGGFAIYLPKSYSHHALLSHAGHFIHRSMEIAGVSSWDKMKGKSIRIQRDSHSGPILAIGHIVKEDWFNPSEDFKAS